MRTIFFTTREVQTLRLLMTNGCPTCHCRANPRDLGERYHVSASTMSRIKTGHITEGTEKPHRPQHVEVRPHPRVFED